MIMMRQNKSQTRRHFSRLTPVDKFWLTFSAIIVLIGGNLVTLMSDLAHERAPKALAAHYSSTTFSGSGANDMTVGGTFTGTVNTDYKVQIDNKEGNITAFGPGLPRGTNILSAGHGLSTDNTVKISGTTNYNGTWTVTVLDVNTFNITATFAGDDATGLWEISPNTFKWSDDGGSTWDATGVAITGSAQDLNNGVTVTFGATTGHRKDDYWTFTAYTYSPQLNNWRWYADEDNATPSTAYAAENTAPPQEEIGKSIPLKLRVNLTETAAEAENDNRKKLRFSTSTSGPWAAVGEIGDVTLAAWVYYNCPGGADNGTLASVVLSDSSSSSKGIHNESNSNSPSNSDHPASTTVEFEYCIENSTASPASTGTTYYFSLYDQTVGQIPLATGKSYPSLTTATAYDLTISAPSAVYLGSWQIGSSAYAPYTFVGGEEITIRDNRGQTSGNSSGWSLTADITTELTYLSWTITKSNMYWISDTITGLFAAPTTNISTQSGSYMTSFVTAASVAGNAKDGLGGFTQLPTMRIYNASHIGDYAGVLTITLV